MRSHPLAFAVAVVACSIAGGASSACSSSSGGSSSGSSSSGGGDSGEDTGSASSSGSGSSSGSASSSGSGSSSGSSGGNCPTPFPPPGTYTETFTLAADAGAGCMALPSSTIMWGADAGAAPGTCTCSGATVSCMGTNTGGGMTYQSSDTLTFTSTGWSGTVTIVTLGADGGVVSGPCTYTVTATM